MKSSTYWSNRANQILADNQDAATEQILRINRAYDKALSELRHDIDLIFIKYAKKHNLTLAEAKRILNEEVPNNVDELRQRLSQTSNEELKDSILAELNKNAYRARISRLEALQQSIGTNYGILTGEELSISRNAYINTINSSYHRTCYEFQKGMNLAFDVSNINTRAVDMILNTKWAGGNYSSRVWNNTQELANRLDDTITRGFLDGKSLSKISEELEDLTECGKSAAERLVRTETTYFNNQAALQGYEEVGIEKYVYISTLDLKTCSCGKHGKPSCGSLDRKVFEIAKQQPGVNCPPMHPFCRCTIRSYINDEILNRCQRRARDPITGKNELVGNMNYDEWYNKHVKGNPQAELAAKKQQNLSADKKQYEKYKEILGKEAPKSIDAFQELKYTDSKQLDALKNRFTDSFCKKDFDDIPNYHKKCSNLLTRRWYDAHDKNIPKLIDTTKSIEEQARQAHGLRNMYRTQARDLMENQKERRQLDIDFPNLSFEEQIKKKFDDKGMNREQAIEDILKTASKTNKKVNKTLGME